MGAPLSLSLEVPFVPIRKARKLPGRTVGTDYRLKYAYGGGRLEMHIDALRPGSRVLVVDDMMMSGCTMEASCRLVLEAGSEVAGCAVILEQRKLKARERIAESMGDIRSGPPIFSVVAFDDDEAKRSPSSSPLPEG